LRRRLEDEVREALIRYAFVPVAVVALLCVAWGIFNWQWSVVRRNGEIRDLTAQIFSETVTDYIDRVSDMTRLSITDAHVGGGARRGVRCLWVFSAPEGRAASFPPRCQVSSSRAFLREGCISA